MSPTAIPPSRITPRSAVRARAGDDPVQKLLEGVRGAIDPKRIEADVQRIETLLATAKRAKDPKATAYENALREAKDRLVAVRLLNGLPDVPRAAIVRNPGNSSERSNLTQANRARNLMAGYVGQTGWRKIVAAILPFLFKAEQTPAFETLSAAQKTQFLAIVKEADAAGQLALNAMLSASRLDARLLGQLEQLAGQAVDKAIDRRQLVSQALVELQDPLTVTQGSRGTCAATSVQILLATAKPALYIELLRGLASPAGRATLPGGAAIAREADWADTNDGGRSIPSRLFQPALMELGNGEELDYQNATDADLNVRTGQTQVSGLEAVQASDLLTQLSAEKNGQDLISPTYLTDLPEETRRALDNNLSGPRDWLMMVQNAKLIDPASQTVLLDRLKAGATPATPIYATIVFAPDANVSRTVFHAVLVTGVEHGKVTYINPWGQLEALSERDFQRSVVNLLAETPQAK